jgi:solute carrier family 35 (UDP-sugar transporter), member A1/2/3
MSVGKPNVKHVDAHKNNARAVIFMALLALQFGFQPILNREFIHGEVIRTVIVFVTEAAKFFLALIMLTMENATDCFKGWQLSESLQGAALPAAIYSVQNLLLQQAYPNLDFVTFNLLNQSKLLSTAFFVFLLMGQKQSPLQCLALLMLMGGAALISGDSAQSQDGGKSENK